MSKRLLVKLAVTAAALSVVTLLQGCDEEEDNPLASSAWAPAGYFPITGTAGLANQTSAAGAGQSTSGSTAAAVSTAAGGGGGTP